MKYLLLALSVILCCSCNTSKQQCKKAETEPFVMLINSLKDNDVEGFKTVWSAESIANIQKSNTSWSDMFQSYQQAMSAELKGDLNSEHLSFMYSPTAIGGEVTIKHNSGFSLNHPFQVRRESGTWKIIAPE